MTMLSASLDNIGILDAGKVALLGYAMVFFGLILLMIVVMIVGKCFVAAENKKKAAAPKLDVAPVVVAEVPKPTAPGSAGDLKLYNVEPRTAAMLMAIVADKMGKPLNELRFISIREVE